MKLKWEDHGMKTPLARAKGLGSANHGAQHWLSERITSIALIPLVIWLVWSIISLLGAGYYTFSLWLAQPVNAIMMILLILTSFYHAALGCQVIVEDYVHNEACKLLKIIGLKLFFAAAAMACVFSVLKIALA